MSERIQKYLANLGIASRRKIEDLIRQERIQINGKIATLGQSVSEQDKITVDNQLISVTPSEISLQLIILNKPVGYISSRVSEKDFPTVFELLPKLSKGRWIAIGRLDVNTSGLLLFTNNGKLAEYLMHPRYGFEREYEVRVTGKDIAAAAAEIQQGIELEDGLVEVKSITPLKTEGRNHWYRLILNEGRNRVVRRLWEAVDCQVNRLVRTRFGEIKLPEDLPSGRWEYVSKPIIKQLAKYLLIQ